MFISASRISRNPGRPAQGGWCGYPQARTRRLACRRACLCSGRRPACGRRLTLGKQVGRTCALWNGRRAGGGKQVVVDCFVGGVVHHLGSVGPGPLSARAVRYSSFMLSLSALLLLYYGQRPFRHGPSELPYLVTSGRSCGDRLVPVECRSSAALGGSSRHSTRTKVR